MSEGYIFDVRLFGASSVSAYTMFTRVFAHCILYLNASTYKATNASMLHKN